MLKGGAVIAAGLRDHAVAWVDISSHVPYSLSTVDPLPENPRIVEGQLSFQDDFAATIYWPKDLVAQKRRPLWNAYLIDAWKPEQSSLPWNKFPVWMADQVFVKQEPYQLKPPSPPFEIVMPGK